MRVGICGAGGFLGTHISRRLVAGGYEVVRISREHFVNQERLKRALDGVNVIINVCGAPIVGKWDEQYKHELYVSRIETTKKLIQALRNMEKKPELFISTSAVSIYKSGGVHDENSKEFDTSYLALLAKEWENEAMKANEYGLRAVVLRLGAVLGNGGGMLEEAKLAFKFPVGMIPGDGKQPFSWVHVEDAFAVMQRVINKKDMQGIYNVVAPEVVTMRTFVRTVGKCIHRPAFLYVPTWLMNWRYAEGAQNLLKGSFVISKRLEDEGYEFKHKSLHEALKSLFEK